jgi:hypothetical protein
MPMDGEQVIVLDQVSTAYDDVVPHRQTQIDNTVILNIPFPFPP